jgi:hypothetical protein
MPKAPTDRVARNESWIEVSAPCSGVWMVAIGALDALVIAPPAVALPPVDDLEALSRWRIGQWPLNEHGWLARKRDHQATTHVITTADVLERLTQIHHPWVRDIMRLQLAQHEAFATPQAGGLTDEERSRHAAHQLHELRDELQIAFPNEDWCDHAAQDIPPVPDTNVSLLAGIDGQLRLPPKPAKLGGSWACGVTQRATRHAVRRGRRGRRVRRQ